MITVAIAGGTGGIGKTIVEELARQNKYKIVVLSRKVSHYVSIASRSVAHKLTGLNHTKSWYSHPRGQLQ
jgi:uncharacterized protein YbjT (DUF2867 family)